MTAADIGAVFERKKPQRRTVPLLLEPDLRDEYDELEKVVGKAEREAANSNDRAVQLSADKLRAELDAKAAEIDDATETFIFQALGRERYQELYEDAQPPSEADEAAGLDFKSEDFVAKLIQASCVEPTLTLSDAERIYRDWSDAEVVILFNGAYEVQRIAKGVPFTGPGIGRTLHSVGSSTTAPAKASPTATS